MIQRIQSLYMFLAVICQLVFCFAPIFGFGTNGTFESLFALSFGKHAQLGFFFPIMFILVSLITLIIVIAFFKYKKRKQQRKLCFVSKLLQIFALLSFCTYSCQYSANIFCLRYWWLLLMAVVYVLLEYSCHAIRKDEELIRSADRIR